MYLAKILEPVKSTSSNQRVKFSDKYVIVIEIELEEEPPRVVPITGELFHSLLFITNRKKGSRGWCDHFQLIISNSQ